MTTTEPTVVDNSAQHRFEILVEDTVAGFTEYHDHGTRRAFLHTEVDPDFGGRGLGSTLVRGLLDEARASGRGVLPYCQFVRDYIKNNVDDYVELVPEADRAAFDLPAD